MFLAERYVQLENISRKRAFAVAWSLQSCERVSPAKHNVSDYIEFFFGNPDIVFQEILSAYSNVGRSIIILFQNLHAIAYGRSISSPFDIAEVRKNIIPN